MKTDKKINISVTKEMLEKMKDAYALEIYQLSIWDDDYVKRGIDISDEFPWSSVKEFHLYVDHLHTMADNIESIIKEHWN